MINFVSNYYRMSRKFSIVIIVFFSVFMLNVSAMAFQQRYDRREDEQETDPFVIEMTDLHVYKFLKNTCFFDLPLEKFSVKPEINFFNDDKGFGNRYSFSFNYFATCQLKFVLIDYVGFYSSKKPGKTFYCSRFLNLFEL